jgi:hypothetical protein
MKRVIAIATATVLALLVALSLNVAAQQPDTRDRTIMTFSSAVELPGMRLEPGTYVFRLADTASRNVIQVFNQDEKEILGQWLFVPAERPEVTGDTVVTFRETSAASTPAVQYWYYPGEKIGKEFIYPKDQAMRIAQRTGATVQTEDGPVTATATAEVSAEPAASVAASGVVEGSGIPEQTTTAVGVSGSGRNETEVTGTSGRNETEISGTGTRSSDQVSTDSRVRQESTIAQSNTSANANSGVQDELPATASPLALSGLLGLLSLIGAAGIRSFRQ